MPPKPTLLFVYNLSCKYGLYLFRPGLIPCTDWILSRGTLAWLDRIFLKKLIIIKEKTIFLDHGRTVTHFIHHVPARSNF